jgi:hypothetical protein
MKSIDLGRKMPEPSKPEGKPSKAKPVEKHYPSAYIEHDGDKLKHIPDSGTITFRHKVTRRTTTETSGKKRHELHMELCSIEGCEGDPGEGNSGEDREAALDAEAAKEADKTQKA